MDIFVVDKKNPIHKIEAYGETIIEFPYIHPDWRITKIGYDMIRPVKHLCIFVDFVEETDAKQDEDNPDGDTRRGWRSDDDWSGDTIWGQT